AHIRTKSRTWRPVGFVSSSEIGPVGLLPIVWTIAFARGRHIDRVMKPRMPRRRHLRRLRQGAVDAPAPWAVALLVIDVAQSVLSHAFTFAPGKHARADRVAGP